MSHIHEARGLKAKRRLIPFVGAGVSANLGLPSAAGLTRIIAEELDWDPEVLRLCGELPQLAQYFITQKGGIGPLRSRLDREFQRSDEAVRGCKALMALASANFPLIYTTNYDRLIEQALKISGKSYHVISKIDDIHSAGDRDTVIVKFHGSFDQDESLVLTEESYLDRLEFESPLDIKLRSDTLGSTLLFLGYSFGDINLRYLVHKLRIIRKKGRLQNHEPIAIMTTFRENEVERQVWKAQEVLLEVLSPVDRDTSLAAFLKGLA